MKLAQWSTWLLTFAAASCWTVSTQNKVLNLRSMSEYKKQVHSGRPTVVKFSADWCSACQMLKKEFEQLAKNPALSCVDFVRVDVDEIPDLADQEAIRGIPTFFYIKDGIILGKTIGGQDPQIFASYMQQEIQKRLLRPEQPWWPHNMWNKIMRYAYTMWSIGVNIIRKMGGFFF